MRILVSLCLPIVSVTLIAAAFHIPPLQDSGTPQTKEDWGPRAWEDAIGHLKNGKDWMRHYEAKEATCPLCDSRIRVAECTVFSSRSEDLDLKVDPYISANPYLFSMWMCPKCNYCAWSGDFEQKVDRKPMIEAIGKPRIYDSYFDIPYSELLKRAEQCYLVKGLDDDGWGWLYLYGAWVPRDSKQSIIERNYHMKAQAKFVSVVEARDSKIKATAAYLVGEVHRRSGSYSKAREWMTKASQYSKTENNKELSKLISRCMRQTESDEKAKRRTDSGK